MCRSTPRIPPSARLSSCRQVKMMMMMLMTMMMVVMVVVVVVVVITKTTTAIVLRLDGCHSDLWLTPWLWSRQDAAVRVLVTSQPVGLAPLPSYTQYTSQTPWLH
jgi:hypothetical protein